MFKCCSSNYLSFWVGCLMFSVSLGAIHFHSIFNLALLLYSPPNCCILLIDPTKNIIKDNERNETHFFIKIYLSRFILKRSTQFVVNLREWRRDIYSERGLLLTLYLLPRASGYQHLHPLASCIVRDDTNTSDRLWIPGSSRFWLDCLNLTAWFSYHVVSFQLHTCSTGLPQCTAITLFTNHDVKAW